MLTAILKSKTILGFAFSYLLGVSMIIFSLFMLPDNWQADDLLYSHWAFSWLETGEAFLPYLGVILIAVGAIISRVRIREAKLVLGNRNLSMVAFVSLIMVQPSVLLRPDVLAAMLLSVATFLLLLSTYKRESVLSEIFHVGLLVGLASLFAGQSVFLAVSVLFSVIILRTSNWKEWAVLILGLAMTAVFVMMFVIWHERVFLSFQWVIQSAWSANRSLNSLNAGHLALVPVFVISFLGMLNSLSAASVAERNIAIANIGWIVGIVLMVLVLGLGWQNGIIFAAFPLSVFVGKMLENTKRWWISEPLLLAIIVAPFLSILWRF